MSVRAKFKCTQITEFEGGKKVSMSAVYGTSGENKDFTSVTPWGQFDMNIHTGAPAADYFSVSQEYYFDITKAE
jgi:hypothetical protein